MCPTAEVMVSSGVLLLPSGSGECDAMPRVSGVRSVLFERLPLYALWVVVRGLLGGASGSVNCLVIFDGRNSAVKCD